MDSRDLLFGQSDSPPALPVAVPLSGSPPQARSRSAEELHGAEQPRQPLCELQPLGGPGAPMVSVSAGSLGLCSHGRELAEGLSYCWFLVATADSDFISGNKGELFSGTVHASVALLQVGKSCLQPLLILN